MGQFDDNLNNLKENSNLIGRDEEIKEILYRIASGNMLLIEGEEGTGKTALLKHAIENFGGKGKVIYLDVGTFGNRFDVSKLLNKKKDMILLIDNIQHLSEQNNKKIKYFYDQDYIKSVVFTTNDYSLVNFTNSIKSRIGRNIIKLKKLNKNDFFEIIEGRLDEEISFSKEVLDKLYKDSANLKCFLENCNSLCGYLKDEYRNKAGLEDIKHISTIDSVETDMETCMECNKKLIEVGRHWRCESCDNFCIGCGALCSSEDSECPRCGIKIVRDEE